MQINVFENIIKLYKMNEELYIYEAW